MTTTADQARSRPAEGEVAIGILLLLGAVTCFACLDATAKWINRTGDPVQTAAMRTLVSFVVLGAFCRPWRPGAGGRRFAASSRPWVQVARGLCIVAATLCSFFAPRRLPLEQDRLSWNHRGDSKPMNLLSIPSWSEFAGGESALAQATAITFAAPLVTALLAGPLLGEWPGPHRLGAVATGFLGMLMVTRPWSGGRFDPAMGLALATALFNSLYAMATRVVARRDPPLTTLIWSGAVGTAAMLAPLVLVWTAPPSATVWVALVALGCFGAAGHWLMVLAHARAPASTLAPFFYAQLLAAVALGWLVFGNWPDAATVAGGLVVAASGLYLLHRERIRRLPPSAEAAA